MLLEHRHIQVAEEGYQTVTFDTAAVEPLRLTAGGILLIPEEADILAEQDIALQEDKAARDEIPELLLK